MSVSPASNYLLYGASKHNLTLYDLDKSRQVRVLRNSQRIWDLKLCYPLAVMSGTLRGGNVDHVPDQRSVGVVVWDLISANVIRLVKFT